MNATSFTRRPDTWAPAGHRVWYSAAIRPHELPRLGNLALQEPHATDLDAMYAELLRTGGRFGNGLSLASVHVHAVFNKMLNDAERKGTGDAGRASALELALGFHDHGATVATSVHEYGV